LLSATMTTNEIMIFNSGRGTNLDSKDTVTLTSSGTAYIQVGLEANRD
jgi:hypothetical protein